jgi:hypothetical protein
MTILRGSLPSDGFTIVDNAWLRDPALSAKAKGILCYIASHAAGYELTFGQMQREMSDGETSLRTGLAELEESGYLTRVRTRDEAGRLGAYEYLIGDVSAAQAHTGKSSVDDASLDDHATKKTTDKKTKERTPSASPRGARLPEGWEPSDETLTWFVRALVPGGRWSEASRTACRREHEKFTDHWLSSAGANARKVDWDRAWKNWMRRAFERRSPEAPVSAPPSPKPFVQQADEYKATKERRAKVRAELIDEAIEHVSKTGGTLPVAEIIERIDGLIESGHVDLDAPNGLKPSVPTLYSGYQDVITADVEEVAGS